MGLQTISVLKSVMFVFSWHFPATLSHLNFLEHFSYESPFALSSMNFCFSSAVFIESIIPFRGVISQVALKIYWVSTISF